MRALATVAILGATMPLAAQDQPAGPTVGTTPTGASISVGGHVSRAVNVVNDGAATDTYFVDNGNYPTLLYLRAATRVSDHLTVGGHVEFSLRQNAATTVSQESPQSEFSVSPRFLEVTFDSTRFGKVWLGRGFMSSFLAMEIDTTQTWRYNLLSTGNSFGGMRFVDARDGSLSDISVNAVFLDLEAFSFRDRIRYDSPAWHGLQISASAGSGKSGDVTLRWNRRTEHLEVSAGTSVQNNSLVGRLDDRVDGGIGLLHPGTGLTLVVAGVRQTCTDAFNEMIGRADGTNHGWTVRGGLRRRWLDAGETRLAVDVQRLSDALFESDRARSIGAFVGQVVDAWNAELYGGYRVYDTDMGPNSGRLSLRSLHGFTVGARIGFDVTFHP